MEQEQLAHDAAYKALFSRPGLVRSLIRDFVAGDFVKDFDFETLEDCKNAFVTAGLHLRHSDCIWRLRWQGKLCYIYIILEFQSSPDNWMAVRTSLYTLLLWQGMINGGIVKQGEKLPPVLPIVLYNGKRCWNAASGLSELIEKVHPGINACLPA